MTGESIVVVVSSLKSLMADQVDSCSHKGLKSELYNSVINGNFQVVYQTDKFWSVSMEMISAGTMKKRESERLHKFDLELDAILISVFINRDIKLNCACACVFAIASG